MEILRWVSLAGVEQRTTWFALTTAAGFCAVVFLVALCARSVVGSRREVKGSNPADTRVSWRRWGAVRKKVMKAMKGGGGFKLTMVKDDPGEVSFLSEGAAVVTVEEGAPSSTPPVWKKKIMMGERCQLPKFSGLILYDEQGNALPHAKQKRDCR